MEMREILVTLISAQDLKKVNTFGRMTVYGVAWIYPNMKVASPLDTVGNLNPTWNATLKLTADERLVQGGNAVLHIDLYDHGSFGNNYVGSSTIPLSDLRAPVVETEQGPVVEDKERDQAASSSPSPTFMTLPVIRPSGRRRGTLNVSVRLGELTTFPDYPPPQDGRAMPAYPPGYGYGYGQYPAQPYPMYQQAPYYPSGGYYGGGYGRSGLGAGLLGGALGGLLLGSLLGGGCGGGFCGIGHAIGGGIGQTGVLHMLRRSGQHVRRGTRTRNRHMNHFAKNALRRHMRTMARRRR